MSIYNYATRIEYGEFVLAARETIAAITRQPIGRINVGIAGGKTARVSASSNGGYSVNLPTMDPGRIISPGLARRMIGFVLHEILHIENTNLAAATPAWFGQVAAQHKVSGKSLQNLFGVFEDYHIEYVGTRTPVAGNAGALLGALNDELYAQEFRPQDLSTAVETYVAQHINRRGLQVTPKLDELHANGMGVTLPPEVQAKVDATLDKLENIKGIVWTQDRLHAVAELVAFLDGQNYTPPQQSPDEGEGQEGDGQPEEQKGDQKGDKQGKEGKQGKGDKDTGKEGKQGKGDKDTGKDEGDADGEAQGEGESQNSQKDGQKESNGANGGTGSGARDKTDAIADAMPTVTAKEAAEALTRTLHAAKPSAINLDHLTTPQGNARAVGLLPKFDARRLADAARRGLKSVETITRQHRLTHGRLDRRALARIPAGAKDVMARRTVSEGITTAVTVMVDWSGSMEDGVFVGGQQVSRMMACLVAAAAIVPAIERAGAECQMALFENHLVIAHGWKERFRAQEWLARRGGLEPQGGTPMADKVLWSTRDILQRKVKRRVVVWLLDGQPDSASQVVSEIKRAEKKGVEHVGIGIQCNVAHLFGPGKAAMVNQPKDLPDAFLRVLLGEAK